MRARPLTHYGLRLDNVRFGEERAGTEDGPYASLGTRRGAALSAPALGLEAHIVKTHYVDAISSSVK